MKLNQPWIYCFHCHKDMCHLCHEEINEEIAIKNGAVNYKKREKQLNICRNNNLLYQRDLRYIQCDICKEKIVENNIIYTKLIKNSTYDVCEKCYLNNEEAKQIVISDNFKKTEYRKMFDYSNINSLLYWIPIIKDNNNNLVLINLNPEDENYKKICLVNIDITDRTGYYIANKIFDEDYKTEDIQIIIEKIILKLKSIIIKYRKKIESKEIYPIHILSYINNIKINYD